MIRGALSGSISIGDLTLYGMLLIQAPGVTIGLMGTLSGLYESGLFLRNLFSFTATRPRIRICQDTRIEVPMVLTTGFEFHDVSFRYPGAQQDSLSGVSFSISPGEKIAIVGENGAGKTTLVKLITRLYDPTSGRITLEDRDLREYGVTGLHGLVSVVFQDFVRYNLTVRENIGFGDLGYIGDDERIRQAASKSGAEGIIESLPNRYETMLGLWFSDSGEDEAMDLSIGDWQKIALARAFIRNAPVLVLDEPTASIDARSESELFERIQQLTESRTVVLISHRFSTVRMADRILVMHAGKIVEQGTHDDLVAAGGRYATLFNLQARRYR